MTENNDVANIIKALTEVYGPRCDDFDADCTTCQAWAELQRLQDSHLYSSIRAQNSDSAEPVAVKPLEWKDYRGDGSRQAKTPFGDILWATPNGWGNRYFPNQFKGEGLEANINAAETNYRATIFSVLASPPAKEVERLRGALMEIRELNTLPPDENGHRWDNSDLIAQTIMSALTNRTPDDEVGNG